MIMLQRSCMLFKSVSPFTTRHAGNACTMIMCFKDCSGRQLHSLVHCLIRSKCSVGSLKYSCLQELYTLPKREFLSFAFLSKNSNSDPKSSGSSNKTNKETDLHQNSNEKVSNNDINNEKITKEFVSTTPDSNQKVRKFETSDLRSPAKPVTDESKNTHVVSPDHHQGLTFMDKPSIGGNEDVSSQFSKEVLIAMKGDVKDIYGGSTLAEYSKFPQQEESKTQPIQVLSSQEGDDLNSSKKDISLNENLNDEAKSVVDMKLQKGKSHSIFLEKAKNLLRKSPMPDGETNGIGVGTDKAPTNIPPPRKRLPVDPNKCSTERNFITPVRAMSDFLLKPSDLEGLRKTKRRSPYENDPPITVYWRKDVEAKAIDVWGSKENLLKEILKRDIERRRYQQNIFTVKRRLRDYRREQGRETEFPDDGRQDSTKKVVHTAVAINAMNFFGKMIAWWWTGSHSMFSECLHSLADTVNQLILAYGIHKSVQKADSDHPYGYTNMKYVASLISGAGIFFLGCGLSIYHGYISLSDPTPVDTYFSAMIMLLVSLVSEGYTFRVAVMNILKSAKAADMKPFEYVLRGNDPSVNVVLLEDAVAVIGVVVAGVAMSMSSVFQSRMYDAGGSILIGILLGVVSGFIVHSNTLSLVGRSIPQERLDKINAELESDVMIRAIHDVKGIDMGNSLVRYKAEMDFDGRELTRAYLDKQDLSAILEEVKQFKTIDEMEEFMLTHGENIVDTIGGEIDRIELKLRKKHPYIRHCDLEIL